MSEKLYEKPVILQTFDEQDLFEQDGDTMQVSAWTHTSMWSRHDGTLGSLRGRSGARGGF
jgi:hypothetical protein